MQRLRVLTRLGYRKRNFLALVMEKFCISFHFNLT